MVPIIVEVSDGIEPCVTLVMVPIIVEVSVGIIVMSNRVLNRATTTSVMAEVRTEPGRQGVFSVFLLTVTWTPS